MNAAYADMERIVHNKDNANIYHVTDNGDAPLVIIMRGLPGSGKSRLAHMWQQGASNRSIISRDDLRHVLFCEEGALSRQKEEVISGVVSSTLEGAISRGMDVVVDATHLRRSHMVDVARTAHAAGASVAVVNVTTPVDVCVTNDLSRAENGGRRVGKDVITDMHTRFHGWNNTDNNLTADSIVSEKQAFALYRCTSGIDTPTVLFDIDGTLAKMVDGGRSPYDWHRVLEDTPNDPVIRQLKINRDAGNTIVIFSGRSDECREDTEAWLAMHNIAYDALFMRKSGDTRKDDIVKREMLEIIEKNYGPVVGVFDDRNQVVDMFRSVGLTVFQVDYGDF